jgi:methylmalonyl-CoA/ethylmalonyl-CoA epimerase
MIGRLNHVAIAVRDIAKASEVYRKTRGAKVSAPEPRPRQGGTTGVCTGPSREREVREGGGGG